jgi:hypothetical protein
MSIKTSSGLENIMYRADMEEICVCAIESLSTTLYELFAVEANGVENNILEVKCGLGVTNMQSRTNDVQPLLVK